MKWGRKYGPEYVNRLYAMVRRHLSGDFHFVCLTDDSTGIRPEVQCLPIPPLDLPAGIPERGWNKLATFSADLHGLRGCAVLDVDVVITGSLDDFFTQPGAFLIIHDYKRHGASPETLRCTASNWARTRTCWNTFAATLTPSADSFATSRPICRIFSTGKASWRTGPQAWCPSFKYHGIPPWPSNYWKAPFVPPGARFRDFSRMNATRPMPWLDGATGVFALSSPPPGWQSTGTSNARACI